MFLILLTFITALTISGVAIYYSILGLAAIFAAAAVPIMIMGSVLEVGKLVTASWLYHNWRIVPWLLKGYLTTAVVILMFITSMGIFGFLSKAHVEQTSLEGSVLSQIDTFNEKILRSENKVERWYNEIESLNSQGNTEDTSVRVDELITVEQGNLNDLFTRISNEKTVLNDQSGLIIANLQSQLETIYERIASEKKGFNDNVDKLKNDIKDTANSEITLLKETAQAQIDLQNDRLAQAQERKDEDIAQINHQRENRIISKKEHKEGVIKINANEVAVATKVQRGIFTINTELTENINAINTQMKIDLGAVVTTNDVDTKYTSQIEDIQAQIKEEQTSLETKLNGVDKKYQSQVSSINTRIEELRTQSTEKTEDIDVRITELEVLIDTEQVKIDGFNDEKIIIETRYRKLEADVGPVKYIAEFIFGRDEVDKNLLERAVRWVIVTIIFVFDPLAVLLLIAANFSLARRFGRTFVIGEDPKDPPPQEIIDLERPDLDEPPRPAPTPEIKKPAGIKIRTGVIDSSKKKILRSFTKIASLKNLLKR